MRIFLVCGLTLLLAGGATAASSPRQATAAPAALRHLELLNSEPAADTTLAAAPARIRLVFSQQPELAGTSIHLTGPGKTAIKLGDVTADSARPGAVFAALAAPAADGAYTVNWRAMSKDGHVVKGNFNFTIAAAH